MTRRYKKRAPLKAQAVFDYRELHKLDTIAPPLKVSTYLGERRSFIPPEDEKFSRHLVPVLILIVGAIGALAVWYS